ncbi:MAG: glutathione S-transferase [Pseudomonadota bacterium]
MKLIIGNKAYSSWSLRGWLACRLSGLPFEEIVVPLYDADWNRRRAAAEFASSAGKVPILWDGEIAVWDSLAIIEFLADRVGRDRFWPADEAARALARSIAAEMHSGFAALREKCTMNVRRVYPPRSQDADVLADLARIAALWAQARTRFGGGGDFLFGDFGAADIMFAPVATRIATYALPVPAAAAAYVESIRSHPLMQDWTAAAQAEEWVIDRFERQSS